MIPDVVVIGNLMNIESLIELHNFLQTSLFQFSFLGNLSIGVIELVSTFSIASITKVFRMHEIFLFWVIYLSVVKTYKYNDFLYEFVKRTIQFNLLIISILILFLSYSLFQIQFEWLFLALKIGSIVTFIAYLIFYIKNIILIGKLNIKHNSSIINIEVSK